MTLTLTPPYSPDQERDRRAAPSVPEYAPSTPSPRLQGPGLRVPSGAGLIAIDVGDRWLCLAQLLGRGAGAPAQLLVGARLA